MSEEWPELGGKEVRFQDRTWRLTGAVDVRRDGDLVVAHAREVDDVRGAAAELCFDALGDDSLNPGVPGEHFDALDRTPDGVILRVKGPGAQYRYRLERVEYD